MWGLDGIFSGIIGIGKTWLDGKQKIKEVEAGLKVAIVKNKMRLAEDLQTNNHEWEMAAMADKDKWIRRVSFIMFSAPFVIAIFAPGHVARYFNEAISSIPVWFRDTYMAINGAIWGISALKNPLSQIANSLRRK